MKVQLLILLLFAMTFPFELITLPDTLSYESKRDIVRSEHSKITKDYYGNNVTIDSVSTLFEKLLLNELIPYWYGTPWTFSGHTDHPDSSSIACGYFVTTTLKHVGIQVNRYLLAQQSALNIIKSTTLGTVKTSFFPRSDDLEKTLHKELNNGIYLVGLDYHVGFLFKNDTTIYFIHSTYLYPTMVIIEEIEQSEAFLYSNEYFVAPLSRNKAFIRKWISGERFHVKRD